MTRDAVFFSIGLVVGSAIMFDSFDPPKPQRGLVVCHADGTSFMGHIDTQGIELADLSNAVGMMCRFRAERMGV